jgi:transposase
MKIALGWWQWSRRLVQDYEQLPENAEAMLQIAMIRIVLRRLA